MNKPQVKRRDFLKNTGSILAGTLLLSVGRLLGFLKKEEEKPNVSRREARHYAPADDLAG